ncbi:MAG TPA: 16S rRNA (adenine(1518)-N(6)/adenine(1519)-N(6))-dimethyltransferase RsmA [Steroidobacteraceae bacterium]
MQRHLHGHPHGHPARRKRFAQHFLHDPAVIERIVHAVSCSSEDHLVEIGPGRGALTRRLLEAAPRTLDAIEIDRDLAASLRPLAADSRLLVHEADALEFDFGALARSRGGRLRIIGNLPYNISTPLLFHLLASTAVIRDMHVMLQREVAARMAAKAGEPEYGRLTIMLAPWAQVETLFAVGPGAFQPPPRVWSAVVRLTVRAQPAFEVSEHFATVVAAAFSQRRKTLRNALRGLLSREQIQAVGLDPGARAETLPPQAFNALAQKLVRSGRVPA